MPIQVLRLVSGRRLRVLPAVPELPRSTVTAGQPCEEQERIAVLIRAGSSQQYLLDSKPQNTSRLRCLMLTRGQVEKQYVSSCFVLRGRPSVKVLTHEAPKCEVADERCRNLQSLCTYPEELGKRRPKKNQPSKHHAGQHSVGLE